MLDYNVSETTADDVPQIAEWIAADQWHSKDPRWEHPERMMTGFGLMSYCLSDKSGPIAYIQLFEDGDDARVAVQFAPEHIVSKKRVARSLSLAGIPTMVGFAEGFGKKGLIFEASNKTLGAFVEKNGFKRVGETMEYRYAIEGRNDV